MSEDQFRDQVPELSFDRDRIELHTTEGDDAEGEFVISCDQEEPLRGIVYSSNPYVTVPAPNFEGNKVRIRIHASVAGFRAGDSLKGEVDIVAGLIETTLPYEVIIDRKYPESSLGPIRSLEDFTALCKERPREALILFHSQAFADFMSNLDAKYRLLYLGFAEGDRTLINLESFLVSAGQKERLEFSAICHRREFYEVTENLKEIVELTKSNWGYFEMSITSDSPIITVEPSLVTPDYFLGSSLELPVFIHYDKLHDGINKATISIDSTGFHESIEFIISTHRKDEERTALDVASKRKTLALLNIYEDFRLRSISTGKWCDDTIAYLDEMLEDTPDDHFLKLYKAQALIVNGRRQDGLWIISDEKRLIENKKSFEWAYLLYLCTLIEPEEAYVDRLTAEIEGIFRLLPEDYRIFWFLLFLRREYIGDSKRKLSAIRQWIDSGITSPILYLEVLEIYVQDPLLIGSLDGFAIRMLTYARRHDRLTSHMLMQVTSLAAGVSVYNERLYEILVYAFEKTEKDDYLSTLVSYLLRCNCIGEKYRQWYEIAIEKEMRLSGLYEAYISSTALNDIRMLPRLLLLYFSYENSLPWQQKAYLYANVVTYKEKEPQIYEAYHKQIEHFALEAMRAEKIDDNLAVLYQNLLNEGLIDEDVALHMGRLFYMKKIICLNVNATRVMVIDEKRAGAEVAPVVDGCAFVRIVDDDSVVFLDTTDEGLLSEDTTYYVQPLIVGGHVLSKLKEHGKNSLEFFLTDLDEKRQVSDFAESDLELIKRFAQDESIRLAYKKQKYPLFLSVLKEHTREEMISDELSSITDDRGLSSGMIAVIIEQLVLTDRIPEAYERLLCRNGQMVPMNILLRIATERIDSDPDTVDDFLIRLCAYLMDNFLSSEQTLGYLVKYYTGPTSGMIRVWKYSSARALDTRGLEERILTQILYVGGYDDNIDQIFASYIRRDPNRMLVEAYVNFYAHEYLLYDKTVPKGLFTYIQFLHKKGNRISDTMRISLSRFLATSEKLSDAQHDILSELIRENVLKGQYFAFYSHLDEKLIIRYHFYDKMFVELKYDPGNRLGIRYHKEGAPDKEADMIEMYDGIYVHEMVVFFGETVTYEIVLKDDGEVVDSGQISYLDVIESGHGSRYARLNQIESDLLYQNDTDLIGDMKDYQALMELSKTLFNII